MPLRLYNVTVRNAAIWRSTKLFSRRLILMTIAMTNISKSKPACRFWYYYVYLCHDYLEAIAINYVVLATLVSPLSINHDGFTTVLFYNGNPSIWKDGLHTEMAPTHDFVHTCEHVHGCPMLFSQSSHSTGSQGGHIQSRKCRLKGP